MTTLRHVLLACALVSGSAQAHDTWFRPLPQAGGGQALAFALGTGNRYPLHESAVGIEQLSASGCRRDDGAAAALQRLRDTPAALWLRARALPARIHSCWAQLQPFEIELPPDKVAVYLHEIQAPPVVHDAWAAMRERGVAWRERYTKHARIEHAPRGRSAPAQPVPMAMDVLLQPAGDDTGAPVSLALNRPLVFQVLRSGEPLAGLAVELRHERAPIGVWRRTDEQGRVEFTPPLAGRWLLRGTDLRLSEQERDRWESRFVTLAFEVPEDLPSGRTLPTRSAAGWLQTARSDDLGGATGTSAAARQ